MEDGNNETSWIHYLKQNTWCAFDTPVVAALPEENEKYLFNENTISIFKYSKQKKTA